MDEEKKGKEIWVLRSYVEYCKNGVSVKCVAINIMIKNVFSTPIESNNNNNHNNKSTE